MKVGDLVKYTGRDDTVHYGVVIEVDERTYGPVLAILQGENYSMWFQRRNLELVNASR